MTDDVLSTLLDMGFTFADCQLATKLGHETVEQALNYLTTPQSLTTSDNDESNSLVLHLNKPKTQSEIPSTDNLDKTSESLPSSSVDLIHSRYSQSRDAHKAIDEKKAKQLHDEVRLSKELKKIDHEAVLKEIQADKRARQEKRTQPGIDLQNGNRSQVTAKLQSNNQFASETEELRNRRERKLIEEQQFNLKMQQKLKEDIQRDKELREKIRLETLKQIEADRKALKSYQGSSCSEIHSVVSSEQPSNDEVYVNIRFRFPDASTLTEKFSQSALVSVVAGFVESQLNHKSFTIAQSFPPFKEWDSTMFSCSLRSLKLGTNIALNVKIRSEEADCVSSERSLFAPDELSNLPPGEVLEQNDPDSDSGEDQNEIPYQPLVNVEEPEMVSDDEVGVDPQDEENGQDNNFGVINRPPWAQQYNFSQRLGSTETSNFGATIIVNSEQPMETNEDSVEIRRQKQREAALSRFAVRNPVATTSHDTLRYNCLTLVSIAADFIVKEYLSQRISILGALDTQSANQLINLLMKRGLLNGKTYHAFISCDISCLDLSGYVYLTNELVRSVSFNKLTRFYVKSGLNLTDAALNYIAEMTYLKHLDISYCPNFTSSGIMKMLRCLSRLEVFEASNTKLSSDSLQTLVTEGYCFDAIISLGLSECCMKDLSFLQRLFPNVETLWLNGNAFTSVAQITQLPRLRQLSIANCFNLKDLILLSGVSTLESLDLTNSCQSHNLSAICESFSRSSVTKFKIPDKSLFQTEHLMSLSKLRLHEVDLSNCLAITAEGFQSYFEELKSNQDDHLVLCTLILSNTNINAQCIPAMCQISSLVDLQLDFTKLDDKGACQIQKLTLLTTLSLIGNNLTDKVFTSVADLFGSLVSLTKLNLSRNAAITNFGMRRFTHPTLQLLAVTHTKVNNTIEDTLKNNLPSLKTIKW